MKERMFDLEVNISGRFVRIMQSDADDGLQSIILHPDQVQTVISWLNSAVVEIRGKGV